MRGRHLAPRRRGWMLSSLGTLSAIGAMMWLAQPNSSSAIWAPVPPDETLASDAASQAMTRIVPAAPQTEAAAPGSIELGDGPLARVIAVRSWAPRDAEQPFIFVCPGSAFLGEQLALVREEQAGWIEGVAVAAPEWAGPCEEGESDGARAGLSVRVVLTPEGYAALMRGDRRWDPGLLTLSRMKPKERSGPAVVSR